MTPTTERHFHTTNSDQIRPVVALPKIRAYGLAALIQLMLRYSQQKARWCPFSTFAAKRFTPSFSFTGIRCHQRLLQARCLSGALLVRTKSHALVGHDVAVRALRADPTLSFGPGICQLVDPHHLVCPPGQLVILKGLLQLDGTAFQHHLMGLRHRNPAHDSHNDHCHNRSTVTSCRAVEKHQLPLEQSVPNERPNLLPILITAISMGDTQVPHLRTIQLDPSSRSGRLWKADHLKMGRNRSRPLSVGIPANHNSAPFFSFMIIDGTSVFLPWMVAICSYR